jgi:hypothetical protein
VDLSKLKKEKFAEQNDVVTAPSQTLGMVF